MPRRGARRGGEWWRGLDGDDVISLEPLCELAYEPFSLPAGGSEAPGGARVDAYNYFDGKILSRYLISSGNFVHPVSRRPLSRDECERPKTKSRPKKKMFFVDGPGPEDKKPKQKEALQSHSFFSFFFT